MPWCEDAPVREAKLMRWVCLHECSALAGCRREVESEQSAGRLVVGMRAGESVRQRARRVVALEGGGGGGVPVSIAAR